MTASAVASAQGRGSMGTGMMGMAHDSATSAQMQLTHELIVNHERISRTVTNLPHGIRTATTSDDPRLARLIKEHVVTMDRRVRRADDAQLPMESPALHAIFRAHDRTLAHTHRGHELGVAADKGAVVDNGQMLVHAVVVARNRAGAYVHARADFGVAQIG